MHKKGTILTKYGITDQETIDRILKVAEKGDRRTYEAIKILHYTGMHPRSLMELKDITHIVGRTLRWKRVRTHKVLSAELDNEMLKIAYSWVKRSRKPSQSWLNQVVKEVGIKAGYPDLAPTTFRHTKCLELIKEHRDDPLMTTIVSQKLGCTLGVVWRNYARLKELDNINKSGIELEEAFE